MDAKMNFEKLATIANSRPLLRFGVKDHYFRACLCAFAMDHIHAKVEPLNDNLIIWSDIS